MAPASLPSPDLHRGLHRPPVHKILVGQCPVRDLVVPGPRQAPAGGQAPQSCEALLPVEVHEGLLPRVGEYQGWRDASVFTAVARPRLQGAECRAASKGPGLAPLCGLGRSPASPWLWFPRAGKCQGLKELCGRTVWHICVSYRCEPSAARWGGGECNKLKVLRDHQASHFIRWGE